MKTTVLDLFNGLADPYKMEKDLKEKKKEVLKKINNISLIENPILKDENFYFKTTLDTKYGSSIYIHINGYLKIYETENKTKSMIEEKLYELRGEINYTERVLVKLLVEEFFDLVEELKLIEAQLKVVEHVINKMLEEPIEYTLEMKKQDELAKENKEDLILMSALQRKIAREAKKKNYKIEFDFYINKKANAELLYYEKNSPDAKNPVFNNCIDLIEFFNERIF